MEVEVRGLVELRAKLDQVISDLHGQDMLDAMRAGALAVTSEARTLAPVDTGRLRASITPEVRLDGNDVIGVVGSVVAYAPDVELGRGPMVVPTAQLETWAKRKGLNVYAVQASIARKGTRAQMYLQRAFETREAEVIRLLEQGVNKAVSK